MWKGHLAILVLLVALSGAQARHYRGRHHRQRDRSRPRDPEHKGESAVEATPHQGQSVPHWLSNLRGLLGNDRFEQFFYPYGSSWQSGRHEPWWEGPNICPRESEEMKNSTAEQQEIRRHFTSRVQYCDESETAFRCKMIEEDALGRREATVIYECCHGFARTKGDFGCPEEKRLVPLLQTAQELGLRDFIKAIRLLQLGRQIQAGNFTVFAPVDGAIGLNSNLMDFNSGLMLSDGPSLISVSNPSIERTVQTLQSAVLGHLVQGLHRTSALQDEQVLETESPDGSSLRINYFDGPEKLMTVNCMRVVSRDHMATNGVIHTVEHALKPVTKSLMDYVKSRRELTMLKTILAKADYISELDEEGQKTLLAPSDMAFRKMDRRLRERLLRGDRKCLERIMHSHILPNVICSSAIQGKARTPNMLRRYINITRTDDDKYFVEDSQILEADVMATNGVMHIIDEVLVPDETLGLMQVLEKQGFTELLRLVQTAKLEETLETITNVTLFAPTNEAIQALSEAQISRLSSDPDMLKKVLLYHISPGENSCQHFYDNKQIPSSEGRQIRLNRYTNFLYPQFNVGTSQCAPITGKGFMACNGKIHVISKVMMPPAGNVIDVLAKDKRFSIILSMVKKAGLADKLQEQGPFTIFAPNDEAFERADRRTLDSLSRDTDQLLKLLKGHVFNGFLCCVRINRGWMFSYPRMYTLAGTSLRLTRDVSGNPKVGNAHVVKCDRTATNGNILELDRVLLHPSPHRRWGHRWRNWRHLRY